MSAREGDRSVKGLLLCQIDRGKKPTNYIQKHYRLNAKVLKPCKRLEAHEMQFLKIQNAKHRHHLLLLAPSEENHAISYEEILI